MAKKTCDVTRYADEYFNLKGVSPFATKSISKGEATSIAKQRINNKFNIIILFIFLLKLL